MMSSLFNRNSDDEWEKYGKNDPYYGVVSIDKFRNEQLTDSARDEFFTSGRNHLDFVRSIIRQYVDPSFGDVKRSLDFGCGVGRCLFPIAAFSQSAVGVEVSEAMRNEAMKNAESQSVKNIEVTISNDNLSNIEGSFDFIHSFAVFQHISPDRGEVIMKRLLALLNEGGVMAIHFIYGRRASFAVKAVGWLRKRVPLLHPLVNIMCGEKTSKPLMEKNCYNLNRLMEIFRNAPCVNLHIEFEGQDEMQSCIIFAQKNSEKSVYDYEAFFKR